MANPMAEFKQSFTKEYTLHGKVFLLKSLNTKEIEDIEITLRGKYNINSIDELNYGLQKTEILSRAILSVDGIRLSQFDSVIEDINSKNYTEEEAIKKEISSWDDTITSLLHLSYLSLIKEKDEKFKEDIEKFKKYLSPSPL